MVVVVMRLVMHASRISRTIRAVHSLAVLAVLIVHHITLVLSTVVAHTVTVSVVRSAELNAPFTTVTHC